MRYLRLSMSLAAVAVLASGFLACQQELPTASAPPSYGSKTITWNAHPEIVYSLDTTVSGSSQRGLWVMDSTGANWRCIYTNSSASGVFQDPSWSGDGSAVAFSDYSSSNTVSRLMRIDVSTSNGIPVGSNLTTLASVSLSSDSMAIEHNEWSPSNPDLVAYTTYDHRLPWTRKVASIMTISGSGGAPTTVYSDTDARFTGITWSPDGSKLAVTIIKGWSGRYLRILDLNGNVLHEYAYTTGIGCPRWSRTGGKIGVGYGGNISSLDTSSGNLTTIKSASFVGFSWSPTDWKIVYDNNTSPFPDSTMVVASGIKTKIRAAGITPSWKR